MPRGGGVGLKALSVAAFAGVITLGSPSLAQDIQLETQNPELTLGTSNHIQWEKVETAGENTVEINLPNETQYYQYTYTKPDNYSETSDQLYDNLDETNTQNVLFNGVYRAIYNSQDKPNINIVADFINDYNLYYGSIDNHGTIGNIKGDFINNYANAGGKGGAVYNHYNVATIGNITGNFISNHTTGFGGGGAIYNGGTIGNITGNFINNFVTDGYIIFGGAIANQYGGTIGAKDDDGNVIGGIINSNFIGNYAKSESGEAKGGAIYTDADLNIIADNGTSIFKDNYVEVAGVREDNAIYVDGATLNFQLKNSGSIYMADNIKGFSASALEILLSNYGYTTVEEWLKDWGYEGDNALEQFLNDEGYNSLDEFLERRGYRDKTSTVNITGDSVDNTTFYMLNDIYGANVNIGGTTINTINNDIHTYNFNTLTLTGDTNMAVDVDLENQAMDRFTATNYGEHSGNLNVIGMNLLSDAPEDRPITEILFAEEGLKNNVTYNAGELPHTSYQTTAYTPIYKYNVAYDNRNDAGYFVFAKGDRNLVPVDPENPNPIAPGGGISDGGSTGNPSDAFNPAVLANTYSGTSGCICNAERGL